jgi:hypothetical protein
MTNCLTCSHPKIAHTGYEKDDVYFCLRCHYDRNTECKTGYLKKDKSKLNYLLSFR